MRRALPAAVRGHHRERDQPERIPPSTLTARLEQLVCQDLVTKSRVSGRPGRRKRPETDFAGVIGSLWSTPTRQAPAPPCPVMPPAIRASADPAMR